MHRRLIPLFGMFFTLFAVANGQSRSAHGAPGPDYWQNRADYEIRASLDTASHRLEGTVKIKYTNNSPHSLDFLWLHLDQNAFRENSRAQIITAADEERHQASTSSGMEISRVTVDGEKIIPLINDTRMQLRIGNPLAPQGGTVELEIDFACTTPTYGADRTGRYQSDGYWIYEIAQWYPRMAVFDDLEGWNIQPYLGAGEFFAEIGNYDYWITVPQQLIVLGSGELQNPKEVLPEPLLDRLEKARRSDQPVFIIPGEEVGQTAKTRPKGKKTLTWHYRLENTRDVAWAASAGFVWDAARINLPSGRSALAMSAYPQEFGGPRAFARSTEYIKTSVEFYSNYLYEYPFPTMVSIAANVGGIEYPGFTFVPTVRTGNALWRTTDHEVAHNWFPMIVGTDERMHGWMDEGMATFLGYLAARDFRKEPVFSYLSDVPAMANRLANSPMNLPTLPPDQYSGAGYYDAMYFKPAMAMLMLRTYILGADRFDFALRSFVDQWAFKHPAPQDLFRSIENAAGEDLDWFWQDWFYSNGKLDQALVQVQEKEGEWMILIENRGEMRMPVVLEFEYADRTEQVRLPAEIWFRNKNWTISQPKKKGLKAIRLDPEGWMPDTDRSNNIIRF